jgi:hypothetical protein
MFGPEAARMLMAMDMMVSQWRPEFYPGRLTLFCCEGTELWTLYEKLGSGLIDQSRKTTAAAMQIAEK